MVKYFLKNGVDCKRDDNKAMLRACLRGHFEIVKYLVENGSQITSAAFLEAAFRGYYEIVKYLIENSIDIRKDIDEAINLASFNSYFQIVEYLNGIKKI